MGGERINYGCTKGWFLIGAPNTRPPLWTIRSSPRYIPDRPGHPTPLRPLPAGPDQGDRPVKAPRGAQRVGRTILKIRSTIV